LLGVATIEGGRCFLEDGMTDQERKDWDELGLMLDLYYENCVARMGEKWTRSLLHGLACLEANGCVQRALARDRDGEYWWDISTKEVIDSDSGYADSHPAALLAMLKAHREMP
jgi:hypothetical protein